MNSNITLFQIAQAEAPAVMTTGTGAPVADPNLPPASPLGGGLGQMLPLILIFAILYFIMIRPAQRKEKDRKKEISEMRAGTKVLFSGGIIGTITEVKDATFLVKVADGVTLEIARGAVQRILTGDAVPADVDAR